MKQTSCLAIVVRHEEKYIQECICYNYILGWDAIVVVIHRDPTDNHPDRTEELIHELPKHILDKVIVKHLEYTQGNHITRSHQNVAYQEIIYPLVKDKFEWLAMFDVNEYLYDSEKWKISKILNSILDNVGQVILTSLTFGHNNQIISAPLIETRLRWFNKRCSQINHKSIIRIDSIINPDKWNDYHLDGNPCLIHYESGAMEDWVNRQYKLENQDIEYKPDYDCFIGNFTAGIKDDRMLIYSNELDTLLRHCFPDKLSILGKEFNTLEYNHNTPVLFLIINNEPDTKLQVFSQIRKAKPKKLYLAGGGRLYHAEKVLYKEITASVDWDCDVFIFPMDKNIGYEEVIKGAVGWFFENESEGIILEDDCLPADSFFSFCSTMLERYRNNDRIGHISGSNFQKGMIRGDGSYYFSSLTHTWGWAGWRRVWQDINLETDNRIILGKKNKMAQIPVSVHIKDYWNYKLQSYFYERCNLFRFQYSYHQITNNRLSVIPNSNLITKTGYSKGPTDFIKNHPFADIPVLEMDDIVHPSLMLADVEADIYSLNLEIKMLSSDFYGKESLFLKEKLLSVGNNNSLKIPKIIHQIYFDAVGPPKHLINISETWKNNHLDWEYRFWNGKMIERFMESEFTDFIPLFRSFPFDVQRWDFVSYLLLYRFGGLYVDMDYESIEPLDSLLWDTSCCFGMEPLTHTIRNNKPYTIGNAMMASVPNHDFFAHIIRDISTCKWQVHKYKETQVMESTGSFMLNRVFDAYENKEDITLLPAELVAPLSLEEIQNLTAGIETKEVEEKVEKAFAIHYFFDSWLSQYSDNNA